MPDIDLQALWTLVAQAMTTWGMKLISAIAIFLIGRLVARWARAVLRSTLQRAGIDETLVPFLSSLTYYGIIAIVIIAVLSAVGVQTASLVAVLGAAGLAVGLALQGTLSHFASGVMLLMFRPFKKGDFVEAGGVAGSVEAVRVFTTTLKTPDNVDIVMPNASVWGQTIRNYSTNDIRRVDLVMGISYDDDIRVAVDVIERILGGDDRVLEDPAPVVAVSELADSSVNLVVRPWCNRDDYWDLRFHLTRTLKEQLEAAGCSIPYPQRDVHLHQSAGPRAA